MPYKRSQRASAGPTLPYAPASLTRNRPRAHAQKANESGSVPAPAALKEIARTVAAPKRESRPLFLVPPTRTLGEGIKVGRDNFALSVPAHMTESQRAMIADAAAELESKLAAKERAKKGGETGGRGRPKDSSAGHCVRQAKGPKQRTARQGRQAGVEGRREAKRAHGSLLWITGGILRARRGGCAGAGRVGCSVALVQRRP